jgi:hypothetical protein
MIVMKLRVPEGCGAISHLGRSLDIAEDNSIEVDDDEWSAFLAHGFRPWADWKEAPEVERMTREELIAEAMDATSKALQAMGTEEIRARLIASEASAPPVEQTSDAAEVDADAELIAMLNRQGLFAFLRNKGVSVSLPVTNEALRALARQSIGLT